MGEEGMELREALSRDDRGQLDRSWGVLRDLRNKRDNVGEIEKKSFYKLEKGGKFGYESAKEENG
jgi:hypothetical protein